MIGVMTSHYHISDINYIVWKMPIALLFRMVINYQVQMSGDKKQFSHKEADKINDLIDSYGELRNAKN